jgi:hypothetical protein
MKALLALTTVALGSIAAVAPAQAATIRGSWIGQVRDADGRFQAYSLTITRLRVGERSGRAASGGGECHGPITLRRKTPGGRYFFDYKERAGEGVPCTGNDRIMARLRGRRLFVRVTPPPESPLAVGVSRGRLRRDTCAAAAVARAAC